MKELLLTNISETEAAETQDWLEYAVKCKYLDREIGRELNKIYPENRDRKISQYGKRSKTMVIKGKNEQMRYRYIAQWVTQLISFSLSHFPTCSGGQGVRKLNDSPNESGSRYMNGYINPYNTALISS